MLPRVIPVLLVFAALVPAAAQEPKKEKEKDGDWVPLFNGKNLDGWTPKIKGLRTRRQPRRHVPRRGWRF